MINLKPQNGNGHPEARQQAVPEASASQIVPKPVPQSQMRDPRRYQLEQLRKRFSPKESVAPDGSTSLLFKLTPSDPDFPFELAHLDCDLRVPQSYPEARPELKVRNNDIPRGFSINVERGWARLAEEKRDSTLLALLKALDKDLEAFLSEQKVDTVKLVAFKDTRHLHQPIAQDDAATMEPPVTNTAVPKPQRKALIREESYTKEQIAGAKARRAQEVRQMETRMGRMVLFRRSADGVVFTVPIEPKRRKELPSGLQSVNSLHLIVPLLYPLQDIRIQLNEAEAHDAEPVEELFAERAAAQKHMTLMSHMNYVTQNLHSLAKQAQRQIVAKVEMVEPEEQQASAMGIIPAPGSGKGHVQVIPRPPEWVTENSESEESDEYDSNSDDGGGGVEIGETGENDTPAIHTETVERGTMLSFPSIELHGIELLQISILSITVKCERCRTENDITGLKPGVEKTSSCKKCATSFAVQYNQQLVHAHSTRAGFIDLSGCKVADMLPSTFIPTCAKCSTSGLGLVSVRGETMTNVCRECHGKFSFKIPEVKFLFISPGTLAPPTTGPRRKMERLGLHAGEPLPDRGSCQHYRKSYRWFRFSCCNKVHACDRCHDGTEDHMNEWANRMICGWCSREQNYAVDACTFCGRSVIGKKGRGFWEGGKGTRDQRMMSRKDPRKYKRIGTTPGAKKS